VYIVLVVISMNEKSYRENLEHLYEKETEIEWRRGKEQRVIKIKQIFSNQRELTHARFWCVFFFCVT
jgi:hypothetical protein